MLCDYPVVMFEKSNKAHADVQARMNRRIPNSLTRAEPSTRNSHHEVTKDTKKGRVIKKLRALRVFVVQQLFY